MVVRPLVSAGCTDPLANSMIMILFWYTIQLFTFHIFLGLFLGIQLVRIGINYSLNPAMDM